MATKPREKTTAKRGWGFFCSIIPSFTAPFIVYGSSAIAILFLIEQPHEQEVGTSVFI